MAIGETFLSAFLQVLFEQLLETGGIQFLEMVGGVDLPKTIKKWKIQLTRLEALLDDAELQQFHSKPVKLWLNDLQDLAYDLEDLLDHFATEAQVYKLKKAEEDEANAVIDHSNAGILDTMAQTIRVTHSRAADSLSNFLKPVDQHIRDKIDEITERLQGIQNQMQKLSLTAAHMMQQQTLQTETLRNQRESTSSVGKVFGRDDKKQEIIKMLLNDDQSVDNYVVIPIVGTGGIGKTTLAQYVYNDEQLKGYFDLKAWVCISDVFDAKRIMTDIINSATRSNFSYSNLDQAQLKLKEVLKGKTFFIVLDDMWSEEYTDWEKLQQPFIHGAKGSRVIITTRNDSIAEMTVVNNTTQCYITKLERLSKDDSWLIFQSYANVDPDLSLMRDNIIEKVNGLPLAAKALGSLLKKNPEKSQRRKILESNVWVEESSVLPVLRLSYHHMPSHLKRVFAYCSVFPKDYKFKEMELVLLWMAQGFLSDPETHDEKMEETGHNYFHDLISRSLFEESAGKMFIMHDLIHDMAQLAAGEVCYVVMDAKREIKKRVRHLCITEHVQTLTNLTMARQLRTFLCKKAVNLDIIQRMHYMRALHLVSDEIKVPDDIGKLKHLRYLSLNFRRIKVLPTSINNLCNLHTLGLDGCYGLELLPRIGWLEKLRHMDINEIPLKEMPHGIGKLTNLQSLGKFVLAAGGGSRVRELGILNHLRGSLTISGVEYVKKVEDAHEAQLNKKESLAELHLIWGTCTDDEVDDMTKISVIEELKPHSTINKCELNGYMGLRFPRWLADSFFRDMVDITLKKCHRCERLPSLGLLPSLKSLWISNMDGIKEVGLEFYGDCSTPFPSLHTLCFSFMESWEKWEHPSVYNGKAFHVLETFYIKSCKSLQGDLPPHLHSLTTLDIQECRQLQCLDFKNLSSSNSCFETLSVKKCESMVSVGDIPLTLHLLDIEDCEKLGCVEFDEQPPNMSPRSDDEKALQCEESIEVFPKASLNLPLFRFKMLNCQSIRSLQQNLLLPALRSLELIECKSMERLPAHDQLLNLTSLRRLQILRCPKFHSLGEGGLPRNLESVEIEEVNIKQTIQEWGLHHLRSLKVLKLKNVGSSVNLVECIEIPDLSLLPSSSSLEISDLHSLNVANSVESILFPHLYLPSSLLSFCIEGFLNLKSICKTSNLPSLTHLSVCSCPSLELFFSAFSDVSHVTIVNCRKLNNFPEGGLPKHLRWLLIDGVDINRPIKDWGLHLLTSLKDLTLINVGSCVDAVESIGYPDFPSSLSWLIIKGFQNLKSISKATTLPNLNHLFVRDCPSLESLASNVTSLADLSIVNCPRLHNFPEGGLPTNLRGLEIRGTNIDKPIKDWGLHFLTSLEELTLENVGSSCANTIESIGYPDFPSSLSWLIIKDIQNLKSIYNGTTLPNLTNLSVCDCPILESLVINFASLRELSIVNCPNLHNLPGGLPTNLRSLSIRDTKIDKPIKELGFHLLTSFKSLTLCNVGSCVDTVECIRYPDFSSSLCQLNISNFQNLKTICCSTLPNLSTMNIKYCPKLKSFGDNALPPHIYSVHIEECDVIEHHLRSYPSDLIKIKNGTFSMPRSQPSSANSSQYSYQGERGEFNGGPFKSPRFSINLERRNATRIMKWPMSLFYTEYVTNYMITDDDIDFF